MRPRNCNVKINSIHEKINVERRVSLEPFLQHLESEVRQNPTKAKKLQKLIKSTNMVCAGLLVVGVKPATTASTQIDPEVISTGLLIMGIVACLAVLAAIIGGMLAGIWKMFFGGRQADAWTTEILKGFSQVMLAPLVIALIIGIFTLLFGNLPAFAPLKGASIWFHR